MGWFIATGLLVSVVAMLISLILASVGLYALCKKKYQLLSLVLDLVFPIVIPGASLFVLICLTIVGTGGYSAIEMPTWWP